jgi:hypothetical protein
MPEFLHDNAGDFFSGAIEENYICAKGIMAFTEDGGGDWK